MPLLKPHRSTILVAQIVYVVPPNPTSIAIVPVFNREIGGIRQTEFVMEDERVVPFGTLVPELNGVAAERAIVFGISPEGGHVMSADIVFPNTIEIVWSEIRLLAAKPTDPNWQNNPAYLIVLPGGVVKFP